MVLNPPHNWPKLPHVVISPQFHPSKSRLLSKVNLADVIILRVVIALVVVEVVRLVVVVVAVVSVGVMVRVSSCC